MPHRHANPGRHARLRACGLGLLLLTGAAMAAEEPYLQLEARMSGEPYQWQLPDGEVIRKGLSDKAARVAVSARDGHEDYVLEMVWGRFPVKVPAACWQQPADAFERCVTIRPREDSAWQREQQAESDRESDLRQRTREARVAWVFEFVPARKVAGVLSEAQTSHRRWLASPEGRQDPGTFRCARLDAKLASAPSQRTLPRADMMLDDAEAIAAYVRAARAGNWRAAGGLFDAMMADEDWESAQAVVAWLLRKRVPAGYNKLATLVQAMSQYEGPTYDGSLSTVESLRWHAAQLGDPAAQSDLADMLSRAGKDAAAERLRACAVAQNPALGL